MFKLDKILSWGLYLLASSLPWQTRLIIRAGSLNSTYYEYATISLYASDILIGLLILLVIFSIYRNRISFLSSEKYLWMWVLLAWWDLFVFISIFKAPDKALALFTYIQFLLGIGLFWLLLRIKWDKFKLGIAFLTGTFMQAVLGLWQFNSQEDFSSKWLGKAIHSAEQLGSAVVQFGPLGAGERWLRAYGGLDHPNMLGGYLTIGLFVILACWLANRQLKQNKLWSYTLFIASFILSGGLVVSFSRAAWLGFVGGLTVMLVLSIWQRKLWLEKYILILVFVFASSMFIYYTLMPQVFVARLSATGRIENKSITERQAGFFESKELISQNFWLGTGLSNYGLILASQDISHKPGYYFQPVHNAFILVLAEIGIFGFLGMLLFWLYILVKIWQEKAGDELRIIKIGIFAGVSLMMLIDHWWWSLHFGLIFYWFAAGFILSGNNRK